MAWTASLYWTPSLYRATRTIWSAPGSAGSERRRQSQLRPEHAGGLALRRRRGHEACRLQHPRPRPLRTQPERRGIELVVSTARRQVPAICAARRGPLRHPPYWLAVRVAGQLRGPASPTIRHPDGRLTATASRRSVETLCFDYDASDSCYSGTTVRAVSCGTFALWDLPPAPSDYGRCCGYCLAPDPCASCAAAGQCAAESWAGSSDDNLDDGHCVCIAGWVGSVCGDAAPPVASLPLGVSRE